MSKVMVTKYTVYKEVFRVNVGDLGMNETEDLREDWVGKTAEERASILVDEGEVPPYESTFVDLFANAHPSKYVDKAVLKDDV